ncbi:BTB/POZ and MATH domain-containing protein 1-like [Miscanthus floridulus]|uniref:BTB/POZ and MATH domain-containing protein 1-like n=1 Tax=Miscanthus floridulus TaxID=154761 RepID=UPI00345AA7D2
MQPKPTSPPPPGRAPLVTTTSSTSAIETVEGTHVFHVCGYSLPRGVGPGSYVRSGTFAVGGYHWSLRFFPDGDARGGGPAGGGKSKSSGDDECCFHADLMTQGADAKACFTIGFVNQADGSTRWEPTTPQISLSTAGAGTGNGSPPPPSWARLVVPRTKVEDFAVLRGDRVSVMCRVAVTQNQRVFAAPEPAVSRVEVPPPDLPECLGRLLEEGVGTDVTIHVGEETFAAHRIVLAMRSPVFRAQLYGPMRDKGEQQHLAIEDVQPSLFRALLGFIYTDALPAIDDDGLDEHDRKERICHLLVVADRFAMERLKMICQGILSKNLAVHTVVAMLALADQHHCDMLKESCFEFILSPNRLQDVVASQRYAELKTTCPSVLVEILEKSSKFCQI